MVESGEITQTYKLRAAIDGFGDLFVGQGGQDAREAIASARDERHIGPASCSAGDGCDAGRVVPCKTHVAGQCSFVHFDLMPLGFQALQATAKSGFVAYCT